MKKLKMYSMIFILLFSCSSNENDKLHFKSKLKPIIKQNDIQSYIDSLGNNFTSNPKNIFIFMVDTLREDYLTLELAPHIYDFKRKSLHPNYGISGATATHHSFFSFFYSRPSYERNLLIRSGYNIGSTVLNILKKDGYNIYGYGCPSYLFKVNSLVPKEDVITEFAQMQLVFAENSSLSSDLTLKHDDYGNTSGAMDHHIIDKIIEKINNSEINLNSNRNIIFSYLCSAHTPFSWTSDIPKEDYPYFDFEKDDINKVLESPSSEVRLKLKNSYRNAVRGIDFQFKRLVDYLKSINRFNDSVVVFMSDHGELIFENEYFSHGKVSRQETSMIPIYIKLGTDTNHYMGNRPFVASLMDIFPTVFDYLGIGDYGQEFFFGESMLNHSEYGAISVTPNLEKDTNQMTLYNKKYKVIVEFDSDPSQFGNLLESQNMTVKDIRDYKDQQIELGGNFKETKKIIEDDFSILFKKMFQ